MITMLILFAMSGTTCLAAQQAKVWNVELKTGWATGAAVFSTCGLAALTYTYMVLIIFEEDRKQVAEFFQL